MELIKTMKIKRGAKYTYVALPVIWTDPQELKRGDALEFWEDGGNLIIKSKKASQPQPHLLEEEGE